MNAPYQSALLCLSYHPVTDPSPVLSSQTLMWLIKISMKFFTKPPRFHRHAVEATPPPKRCWALPPAVSPSVTWNHSTCWGSFKVSPCVSLLFKGTKIITLVPPTPLGAEIKLENQCSSPYWEPGSGSIKIRMEILLVKSQGFHPNITLDGQHFIYRTSFVPILVPFSHNHSIPEPCR